ncbi:MAG: sulfatase-like hydrolase/transferase [Chloroflexi bacterium]|nr:sulfatase-like hydrolase/transferase [Chloroflexota bacterium]
MKRPTVIHPLLFALLPVLFLYAHNRNEAPSGQVLVLLGASLFLAGLLWLLFSLLLKDRSKAGIATSALVLLFFTYGRFYSLLEDKDLFVPGHGYLLPGILLALGYGVYFIHRARRDFSIATRVLNIAAIVLIVLNAFNVASNEVSTVQASLAQSSMTKQALPGRAINTPDIYFIILDEYAHPDTIKEQYGYDNSRFIDSLRKKGFFVANGSRMHNEETIRAVASILNMEYTPETEPPETTYQRIINNKVADYFRSIGYRYVYFGQWYETDRYKINADTYFNFYENTGYGPLTSEFTVLLWNTTMLRPFYNYIAGGRYEGYYREGLIRTLDQLKKVPEMEGPKFVYAHIMSPHAPFVFGPNGERIAPADFYNFYDQDYYLGQYVFTSRQIDKVIEDILSKSTTDPIIVVQSDHGVRWHVGWEKILNAYHLPGDGGELLYESISPVNTFRLILNHYFNADFELLEDR